MRIALDAMGGDKAPGPIVAGAIQAVSQTPDLSVVLVGDEPAIAALIPADASQAFGDRLSIVHCSQTIDMGESPLEAMRRKPDNSISRSWQLLAEKQVEAVVSAGSTGGMVAGAFRLRKFLKNVQRPGIASIMPTAKGPCVIVDVGANTDPKPLHLFQYGAMGRIFAKHMFGKDDPTIGLMNVGEEQGKGNDLAKKTFSLFANGPLKESFVGNIEGRDIHRGACDVVVCDGFVGNVILKLSEGVFEFIMKMVGKDIVGPLPNDRALAMQNLQTLVGKYDYSTFGGAPLLGIDGLCMICHGSSGEVAIRNALMLSAKYLRQNINDKMVAELEGLPTPEEE